VLLCLNPLALKPNKKCVVPEISIPLPQREFCWGRGSKAQEVPEGRGARQWI